jgi:hypothetical protein
LVHCYEGVSRAPTFLASYLIWKYNLNREYVVNLLKEKRHCVDINLGFLFQLDRWNENRLSSFTAKAILVEKCGAISVIERVEDTGCIYAVPCGNREQVSCTQKNDKFEKLNNLLQTYEKISLLRVIS